MRILGCLCDWPLVELKRYEPVAYGLLMDYSGPSAHRTPRQVPSSHYTPVLYLVWWKSEQTSPLDIDKGTCRSVVKLGNYGSDRL